MKKPSVFVIRFKSVLSPWQVFQSVELESTHCFLLDSAGSSSKDASFSYLGVHPFLEVSVRKDRLKVSGCQKGNYPAGKFSEVMRKLLRKYKPQSEGYPFFTGGAVGFLSYETARFFEDIKFRKKTSAGAPDLHFGFYDEVIIFDHKKNIYYLAVQAENPKKASVKLEHLESFFTPRSQEKKPFRVSGFKPEVKRAKFEAMVRKARKYIEAGDIYQANLSQRFSFKFQGSAVRLYGALRKINPSPFASYLKVDGLSVISSSPERLVSKRGRVCETRPIAGTRPRKAGRDNSLEKELLASPKERAEHIMLVDLGRNDLGRVCDYKTVKVKEMMGIEKYSHVIHIVSKITGTLSEDKDGWNLIQTMFPGGTITGCPKVRCMEIIDELEPAGRGLYTGSIGYFDFNGDLDFNIIIRTIVLQKNTGHFQVGAGIVYDSDPAKEYEETLHKGEALVHAIAQAQEETPRRDTIAPGVSLNKKNRVS